MNEVCSIVIGALSLQAGYTATIVSIVVALTKKK